MGACGVVVAAAAQTQAEERARDGSANRQPRLLVGGAVGQGLRGEVSSGRQGYMPKAAAFAQCNSSKMAFPSLS